MSHLRISIGCAILLCCYMGAQAQRVDWNMSGAKEVNEMIDKLPLADQMRIEERLRMKGSQLRGERIDTSSGHLFLVQGVGDICGANNCEFWILSGNYKVLLEKVTQTFKLLPSVHRGLPDLMTSMEGGAYDSSLSYWQFQGKRYVRVACADAVYGDADGNAFKSPHISPHPCGTGG